MVASDAASGPPSLWRALPAARAAFHSFTNLEMSPGVDHSLLLVQRAVRTLPPALITQRTHLAELIPTVPESHRSLSANPEMTADI